MNYDEMTEEELRALQVEKNEEIKALRAEVLRIQEAGDRKQQERYQRERLGAFKATEAESAAVQGEAASAVSEVERLLGEGE